MYCFPESLQRQRDEREERRLQDLDDEEYEALSEEEKELVQQIHMKRLQQEKARYSQGLTHGSAAAFDFNVHKNSVERKKHLSFWLKIELFMSMLLHQ